MRPGNHTVLVALASAMWFGATESWGEDLSRDELVRQAQQELDAVEYTRAYELYERLERVGGATVEALAEQYQRMAEIAASVRQSELAVQQYRRLLAIAPGYQLAAGAPPIFESALAEARERNGPLEALQVNTVVGPDRTAIDVIIARDTLNLISIIALDENSDGSIDHRKAVETSARVALPIRDGNATTATVLVFDSFGNELVARRKVALGARASAAPDPARDRNWYGRPSLWLGVSAVAAGGVAIAFGLRANSAEAERDSIVANSSDHTYREAIEADARARSSARNTNIALAATGALAVAALASLLFFESQDRDGSRPGTGVVVTGDGVQALMTGRF